MAAHSWDTKRRSSTSKIMATYSSNIIRPSVRLNSSKSQHLLCDLWFLKWLGAVVWVFLAIADWDTGFADVAVSFVSKLGMSESFIGGLTSGASEWCLARY